MLTKLSRDQQQLIQNESKELLKKIQCEMGMTAIQERLKQVSAEVDQEEPRPLFFNRFESPLRYFNANTPTSAYKSAIIGPFINFLGRVLNFASDEQSHLVAELFTVSNNKNKARTLSQLLSVGATWAALGMVLLSSLGALLRLIATVVDFTLDAVFSPRRTLNNIGAALTHFGSFFKNINRHYQLTTAEPQLIAYPNSSSETISIKTLTMNVGMLRSWFWDVLKDKDHEGNPIPFNQLKPPQERIDALIEQLVKMAANKDVICLQEMFDSLSYLGLGEDCQEKLIAGLKLHFPYVVSDIGHRSWPFVSSGLIVFSKHPILEVDYHRYPNLRGIDTLSNKGFVGVKIQIGDRFITVYDTHTQAGTGGLPTEWMEYLTRKKNVGGTGDCRNEELGFIHEHMQLWASKPPVSATGLRHLDTYLMGDLNQGMNNFNKIYGVSHGKKRAGRLGPRIKDQVKYSQQQELMRSLSMQLPDNFVDLRIHTPLPKETNNPGEAKKPKNLKIKTDLTKEESLRALKENALATLVTNLKQHECFAGVEEETLKQHILEQFAVFTGSVVSEDILIASSIADQPLVLEPGTDVCADNKMLDVNVSKDFDHPRALAARGLGASSRCLRLFAPEKECTDHAGIEAEYVYSVQSM